MGKPKGKGPRLPSNENLHDMTTEALSAPRPGSPLRAADGHNVDGWADEDIKTYNELLTERAKLEKEKNELEHKSSRHQTQRALLDENATALDSLFSAHLGGDFKFTGWGKCCLDFDETCGEAAGKNDFPCKHELCTRAKTKGVSWMEMDTIKYYHARIVSEKSHRMQSALRKQRDVELLRVKKDDEEEAALRARRNAILDKATRSNQIPTQPSKADKGSTSEMPALDILPMASKEFLLDPKNSAIFEAAKDNEHIVRRIRGRLDKIRHDVNAGRVSPADARVKLDQANSEMAEAERKNNEFRQMILDAEPALSQLHHPTAPASGTSTTVPANLTTVLENTLASSNPGSFSQALSVMKGFFSASDPQDVQTAITDLRSVLELNGPMSPVLKKSFNALEDMLSKPNATGFTVDVTTSDGKTTTCNNVVEVMMNLRLKMQGSDKPSTAADPDLNLDEDTIKANLECIKVEDAAKKEMIKIAERMADDTVENVTTALKKIKAKATLKSPIPPLSDIVLDDVITDILFRRSLKALVVEAGAGTSSAQQLSAKLTTLIVTAARNKPDKFLPTLNVVKAYMSMMKKDPPQVFLEALSKVNDSMPKFVAAHEEKLKKGAAAPKPASPTPAAALAFHSQRPDHAVATRFLVEGKLVAPLDLQGLFNFLRTSSANDPKKLRARISEYYHRNLEEGIWDVLRVVLTHQTSNKFFWMDFDKEKMFYTEYLRLTIVAPHLKLPDALLHFQELGLCPGRAAILQAQRITLRYRENFDLGFQMMLDLKTFVGVGAGNNEDWVRTFGFVAESVADLFGLLNSSLLCHASIEISLMAVDILGFICTFVLGSMTGSQAKANLRYLEKFIFHTLLTDMDSRAPKYQRIQGALSRFYLMCEDASACRCLPDHTCQARLSSFAKEKLGSLVPAPLKVHKPEKERLEDDPSSPLFQTSSGLPRDAHLKLMIGAYWDMAQALTPHLKCIASKKKCSCGEADQEFGEELQVLKNSLDVDIAELTAIQANGKTASETLWGNLERSALLLQERPLTWPGNQKRLKELRSRAGNSRFAELLPPEVNGPRPQPAAPEPTPTNTTAASRHINLKKVPVNVPSIQNNVSSTTSEKGNLEKDAAEVSPNQNAGVFRIPEGENGERQADAAAPRSNSEDEDNVDSEPWPMSDRELELRKQLLAFTDCVDKMHSIANLQQPGLKFNQHVLDGVAWQIEDTLIGHVQLALLIAKAQEYHGLKAWIEYYYKNTMPTPLDESFNVSGVGSSGAGAGMTDSERQAKAAMALEYIAKVTEKARSQTPGQAQMGTQTQTQTTQVQTQPPTGKQKQPAARASPAAGTPASATASASAATSTSTSAVVQQAEQAVADVEQLGRNFIQQMQIVSGRKKRMPRRKR
ncbi:hypothetical protein CLCR_09450 [Cladophialophora carrionii]|uniref:Uncharacterized protein n=1 Tax=Cladophialophora carrionii TaxID=86049 RepID=A0A1C1CYQ3_9EURO|nr:hypothetical protein CLCR_09450 [Cladophialophora carrionii]